MPSLMDCLKTSLGLSHLLVPDILTTADSENIIARYLMIFSQLESMEI